MSAGASILKAFFKSSATKTDDLIVKGSTGQLFKDTTGRVDAKKSEAEVEVDAQASQPPVEPPKNNQADAQAPKDPEDDVVKQAEDITAPKDLEGGRPSAKNPEGRNINFNNITDSEDALTVIDNIGEQNKHFIDARGGTVSHEETVLGSAKVDLEEILGFKLGDGVSPTRVTGARIALQQSADNLKKMAETILRGDAGADTSFKMAFRQAISTHVGIQQAVAGMAAESGRSLNAWRIPVGAETGSKSAVFRTQLQEAFERSGGDDAVDKMAQIISEAEDLADVTKKTKALSKATTGDMVLEYWINGLLSSPATHSVNMTSNAMVALWSIPERMLAASFSKIFRSHDGVQIQEAVGQLYGVFQGTRDGLRLAWRALKTGEPTDPAMKLEARQYRSITSENLNVKNTSLAKGVDLLGEVTRLPGRFLGAEDEFFKSVGYRMELNALAYRKAVSEGLEGPDLAQRVIDLIENPTEEIHLAASNMARVQTFTNPLGDAGRKVQQLANAHPALKLLLPFVRTPVNIVKYVGVRSPLAPFAKSVKADIAAGGARRDLALSRIALGSSVMGVGVMMASEGTITGAGPKDKELRDALRLTGWQPYSIKIGDEWHSYNRVDPLGMFLGLAADTQEAMKYANDADATEVSVAAILALAKNLTSKTYLRGLSDTMNAISDPDRYAEGYFRRQLATFTPMTSLVANIERDLDPTMRATYTVIDQIKSRTPGLSDSLPPRRNLWGEPIVLQGGLGWDFVSPIYSSKIKDDPVAAELVAHEIEVTLPRKKFGQGKFAVELKPREYDRYAVLVGKGVKLPYYNPATGKTQDYNLRGFLAQMMKSDIYKMASDGPDGGKATIVLKIVNGFKQAAQQQLYIERPGLYEEVKYQKMREKQAMMNKQTIGI